MNKKQKGLLFAILLSIFFSSEIVLVRIGLIKGAEPLSFIFQVIAVQTLFLFLYFLIYRKRDFKKINKKDLFKVFLIGVIGTGLASTAGFFGLSLSSATNYGFIIKTTLIFTVFLAFLFLGEKINWRKIILMLILLIGVYLISTKGKTLIPYRGDLLIVLSAFFYSISSIIAKPLLKKIHPDILAFFRTVFGFIFLFLIVILIKPNFYVINDLGILILVGLFGSLAVIFLYRTLEITTASYMTMMNMLTPIFVAIIAFFILKEIMDLYQIIGGSLIIIAGFLIHRSDIWET